MDAVSTVERKEAILDFVAQKFTILEAKIRELSQELRSERESSASIKIENADLRSRIYRLNEHVRRKDKPFVCEVIKDTWNKIFFPNWFKQQERLRRVKILQTQELVLGFVGDALRGPKYPVSVDGTDLVDIDI